MDFPSNGSREYFIIAVVELNRTIVRKVLNAKNLSEAEKEISAMLLQGARVEAYEVHTVPKNNIR